MRRSVPNDGAMPGLVLADTWNAGSRRLLLAMRVAWANLFARASQVPKDTGKLTLARATHHTRRHEAWAPRGAPTILVVALFSFVAASTGQATDRGPLDHPLVTDRPDFTESTEAVPTGYFQLEAGYTFTYDREGTDRIRGHTAPELLLRIGVAKNLELRLGWDGYLWSDSLSEERTRGGRRVTRDDNTRGAHDLSLGLKYKFVEQDGLVPHLGVIAAVSMPSGTAGFSSGDVDPEVVLLWAYDVSDTFAVAGNVGVASRSDGGERFFQAFASLSAAVVLSAKLGAYVEYFGLYPNAEDVDAAHSVNFGLTYLINNNLQLDWRIGVGLNEEADDFFAGAGFAWRF